MSLKKIIKMKTCLFIVILHAICEIKCASVTIGAVAEGNETQQVQELEREKEAIYKQLNDAIADTIQTLEKSNDTDARQGITYMHDLLALVDSFNGTELVEQHTACNGSKECSNETHILKSTNSNLSKDARRQLRNMNELPSSNQGYDHIKHAIIKSGLFKSEDELNKKREEKVRNLMRLQKKLDVWMKMRETEKQKIKMYKLRQVSSRYDTVTEECPNFGQSRKKKKKGDSNTMKKYPCCRKCCKKSYLGCLKRK